MTSSEKRKIAIYTGNRAEYGLQFPIIKAIDAHPDLDYYLLVSGAHLEEDYGQTKSEIEKDGFKVTAEVFMKRGQDSLYSTVEAIGTGILSLSKVLDDLKPDILVVYADRFEGFSAMITGTQMNIPTAHIEGGDITEGGALDDSVRHAMTKLAHLHFATNEEAAERIRGLGEEPWRVFNIGYPTIDLIKEGRFAGPNELVEKYGIDLKKPLIIFTQHSVTTEYTQAADQIAPSLKALRVLAEEGCEIIITYPNNDAGGNKIIEMLNELDNEGIDNIQVHQSLGRYNFHGILNLCGREGNGVCVGNSSSGIKETPAFGCPTVNIGSRQNGRLRSTNLIDTGYDAKEILDACRISLFDEDFRKECAECDNPYGDGNSGKMIADVLATIDIDSKLLQKKMTF